MVTTGRAGKEQPASLAVALDASRLAVGLYTGVVKVWERQREAEVWAADPVRQLRCVRHRGAARVEHREEASGRSLARRSVAARHGMTRGRASSGKGRRCRRPQMSTQRRTPARAVPQRRSTVLAGHRASWPADVSRGECAGGRAVGVPAMHTGTSHASPVRVTLAAPGARARRAPGRRAWRPASTRFSPRWISRTRRRAAAVTRRPVAGQVRVASGRAEEVMGRRTLAKTCGSSACSRVSASVHAGLGAVVGQGVRTSVRGALPAGGESEPGRQSDGLHADP